MLSLPGYETLDKIYEGKNTRIYRAKTLKNGRSVVFKTINSDYPTPEIITRLKKEFEITARFQNGGVIRALELTSFQNCPVLILEDFGGVALGKYLEVGPLGIGEFLSLALRLAEILGVIHAQNIIHKDINPANIVWNRELDLIKVLDFGISLELSREVTGIKNPNVLEGTLAYISPEQTGRMNRFLDYRTDYYSLGVTFFRMLTGGLPFKSRDAMELVYAHIARQAPLLHELDEKIPRAISDIVHKLMAKNVEDRYQSAGGLVSDLEKCKREWSETGRIPAFAPGAADVSGILQIPQKLYGREGEIAALLGAFERVSQGERELMLVSGLPGIGKSALVNEIQKPIVKSRGNFIAGKYDKFKMDVPYSALIQAFAELMKHLLAESEEELALWKKKILKALGPNGRVITDVIPELELIIGKQADIPDLGPDESRNRFNLYFNFFLGVFCKKEHPLVLFLDDLQWADHASLEMIKLFLSDSNVKHLFMIGAFRSDEVDDAHALNLILDDIGKSGTGVSSTSVTELDAEAVFDLLCDSLRLDRETVAPLVELLLRKTGGNPFFLGEFLKTLYQKELLQFIAGAGWTWDVHKIEALQVTDNVVQLMAGKIQDLPRDCGALLKVGACFGNFFGLDSLSEITDRVPADIQKDLNVLLEVGFLIQSDRYYKFTHDRIQEAAYGMMPVEERVKLHHRIGYLEFKRTGKKHLPQKVFYIVNHLNAARELIVSDSERRDLAQLNLLAGSRAHSSAAYKPALNFLDVALGLLVEDAWGEAYELTLSIYQEATSVAYLCGDYERMDQLGDLLIDNARSVQDTVSVYEAKIFAAVARNQLLEAVRTGQMILGRLGLPLPAKPTKWHILRGLLALKFTLLGKTPEKIENLPERPGTKNLAVLRILSSIGSPAYFAMPDLVPLIIFSLVRLSVKQGGNEYAPYAYAAYGMIQCGVLGDMDSGYSFGQLALRLIEKLNVKEGRARALFVNNTFIRGWKEPLRNSCEPLKQTLRSAMENGDPEFICHAANLYIIYSFLCGRDLTGLRRKSSQFIAMITNLKQLLNLHSANLAHQQILNLMGLADDPCILKGLSYNIDDMLPIHLEAGDRPNVFAANFDSGFLHFLFGKFEESLSFLGQAESYLDAMISTPWIPQLYFYKSLGQLALFSKVDKSRQSKFLSSVSENQKKMKAWAKHAPMNFKHKFQLVKAEKARVQGKEAKARRLYEMAIAGARENQYLHEEALALELFAKFWLELGKDEFAGLYMSKARQAYRSWGALAKVNHLEDTFPRLMLTIVYDHAQIEDTGATVNTTTEATVFEASLTTGHTPSGKLDLGTVIKGSQAISSEIVLGNLLRKMMTIVMENAGARSGFLILEHKGKLYVEAVGDLDSSDITVLQSLPVDSCPGLSTAIVQYVARTKENVVLGDAAISGPFTQDAHILSRQPKSILCLPVLNQGNLSAILYLENNLSTGAFTADRLEVLNILSSQIAVSIDNASLYANLEGKVQERTAELQDTLNQVQALKDIQDGDYYLTSLLINPLARNDVKSERVAVDFLVAQKKDFKYKKWEKDLGGDICIAHTIILEDRPHTIFLNADAMGKSMQGAGGALVLGAVFQSIIERTRLDSFDGAMPAVDWLREVVLELQKVFVSFDGSMLISLVLGALCDDTGALFIVNGEHPWTVLYRAGKARFMEGKVTFHKLGMPKQVEEIPVYNLALKAGDVLIAGSDGRDDILLLGGNNGEKNFNDDETQFLRRVEEGGGVLPDIKGALLKQGRLTDDLSLVRVEYKGDNKS